MERFEYYHISVGGNALGDDVILATVFTAIETRDISKIKVKIANMLPTFAVDDFTVSLRNASVGVPTGADIISHHFSGSELESSYLELEFTFSPITLTLGSQYAVCVYTDGNGANSISWQSGEYGDTNTTVIQASNLGFGWDTWGSPRWFEIWGESPIVPIDRTNTIKDLTPLEAMRNLEMSARGRTYIDNEGNFRYESRFARNL